MVQGVTGRLVAAVGIGALVAIGLAACTPEPGPPDETVTSSAAPTTSEPTPAETAPTPPEKPADMERTDEVGALAAAEYFMAVYSYARLTGQVAEWDALGAGDCEFCSIVSQGVESIYGAGDRLVGGETVVDAPSVVSTDTQLVLFFVQVHYDTAPSTRIGSDSRVVAEYGGESGWLLLNVAPSAQGWRLLGGEQVEGPLS